MAAFSDGVNYCRGKKSQRNETSYKTTIDSLARRYLSTVACDPASGTEYWIDDIMIDHRFQGRGYGRAAMLETLRAMTMRYPQCRGVQLTCFRANTVAAKLYRSLGFVPTGAVDDEFGEPTYILKGAALERYWPYPFRYPSRKLVVSGFWFTLTGLCRVS